MADPYAHRHSFARYDHAHDAMRCRCGALLNHFGDVTEPAPSDPQLQPPPIDDREIGRFEDEGNPHG